MKQGKMNEQTKIVLLGVGVVLVFGNIVYRTMHANDPVAQTPTETVTQVQTPAPAATASASGSASTAAGSIPPESALVFVSNDVPIPQVDLFREVLPKDDGRRAATSTTAPSTQTSTAAAQRFAAPAPPPGLTGNLPPYSPLPLADPRSQPTVTPAIHNEEPAADRPRLTGIISGDSPVAVVSVDGRSKVLHPGDVFGDGYELVSIDGRSAKVKRGPEIIVLKLGAR